MMEDNPICEFEISELAHEIATEYSQPGQWRMVKAAIKAGIDLAKFHMEKENE